MLQKDNKGKSTAFFHTDDIFTVSEHMMIELKREAKKDPKGVVRICLHRNKSDVVQEMIIAMRNGSYIRPHKHINRTESFHIIEGNITLLFFDNDGNVNRKIDMSSKESKKPFIYRLSSNIFHMVIIQSKLAIIHEVVTGPFGESNSEFAAWSPKKEDKAGIHAFLERLNTK
jgi:cupin fold WbuC family metalloprotein